MRPARLRLCVAAAVFWTSAALAGPPRFGPFGSGRHPVTREAGPAFRVAASPDPETFMRLAYDYYSRFVTRIDGARCIHRPTCARFGLLAVRRHGAVGLLLTMDRLVRRQSSSAVRRLHLIDDTETPAYDDPLEESTFWFSD